MKVLAVVLVATLVAGCGLVRDVSHWVEDCITGNRTTSIEEQPTPVPKRKPVKKG